MPNASVLSPDDPIRAEIGGNRIELIETGAGRLDTLLQLIGGAEQSIRMIMYIFRSDPVGTLVRDALTAAAARGVEVKLLVDGFGSGVRADFFDELEAEGGQHCLFNARYSRKYLLRNHQKLVVVDDRTALLGGANIEETYLTDSGPGHWRDLWLRLDGPDAAVAARYVDAVFRWSHRKHPTLRPIRRLVSEFSEWRGPLQWKFAGPLSLRNSWWRSIGRDLRRAKRVDMVFAYFAPPGAMRRRIMRAGRRGQVRIITASKSDNNVTIAAARHSYSRLLRAHVDMYEYEAARLHTKLAIVDDVVHIGSSNFDYRSFYLNLEVMLRIKDAAFADAMRGYFEGELKDSEWITPDLHKRRANLWLRLKWAAAHFLVNIMDYTVTRRLNFRI